MNVKVIREKKADKNNLMNWLKGKRRSLKKTVCRNCFSSENEYELIGAPVKCLENENEYIVPLCQKCYDRYRNSGKSFLVDKEDLFSE